MMRFFCPEPFWLRLPRFGGLGAAEKRVFASVLTLALALPVCAKADPMVPTLIVDANSGEVLHAESATRPWFPASTTKLMTAYVALRMAKNGEVSLDTPLVTSPFAARQPPSKIGLKPGQEITLDNALHILMVKSANDVSTVVAEALGGSVAGFAQRMNQEARRLGMRESHFVNPHGLHHEAHVSSARDMAVLARALLREFPEHQDLWAIPAVQLGKRRFDNTNGLIGRYDGAMGMKTGFVCASGFNLVSAAHRNGRLLIAVVFGAGSAADRTLKAAQLLDQGFSGGGFSLFGGSQGGRRLETLTASVESQAPNRRADICGKRGMIASDEDTPSAFNAVTLRNDPPDMRMGYMAAPQGGVPSSVGERQGERVALAPRLVVAALPVFLGRRAGSDEQPRYPIGMGKGAGQNKGADPGKESRKAHIADKAAVKTKTRTEAKSANSNAPPPDKTAPPKNKAAIGASGTPPADIPPLAPARPAAAASLVERAKARAQTTPPAPPAPPTPSAASVPAPPLPLRPKPPVAQD